MSDMLLTAYNGSILGPIAQLLGWVMNGIYFLMSKIGIENVGLSIIIFTIVIYICLFPLTYKQQKFSKLSQKMQPELQAINKKYNGKKDQASMAAMQEETQAVYAKYGVSMMGSCVQMLIQMPLLFALYRVFMNVPAYVSSVKNNFTPLVNQIMATDGYQDKMAGIVTDLRIITQPTVDFTVENTAENATTLSNYVIDVLYKMGSQGWDKLTAAFPNLSGSADTVGTIENTQAIVEHVNGFMLLDISNTPFAYIKSFFFDNIVKNPDNVTITNVSLIVAIMALLIPVISYLTQILNMKMMPQTTSPNGDSNDQMAAQMKMMNKTMPLFSLVMCFTVPVGLGIYWIAGALVRSVQQYCLNKHFDKINLEDIIKKNQEKAKKKREKMGIAEKQITNAARMNTKKIDEPVKTTVSSAERDLQLEKAAAAKSNAKPGSMAAKANMVRDFNERNNRKN